MLAVAACLPEEVEEVQVLAAADLLELRAGAGAILKGPVRRAVHLRLAGRRSRRPRHCCANRGWTSVSLAPTAGKGGGGQSKPRAAGSLQCMWPIKARAQHGAGSAACLVSGLGGNVSCRAVRVVACRERRSATGACLSTCIQTSTQLLRLRDAVQVRIAADSLSRVTQEPVYA